MPETFREWLKNIDVFVLRSQRIFNAYSKNLKLLWWTIFIRNVDQVRYWSNVYANSTKPHTSARLQG